MTLWQMLMVSAVTALGGTAMLDGNDVHGGASVAQVQGKTMLKTWDAGTPPGEMVKARPGGDAAAPAAPEAKPAAVPPAPKAAELKPEVKALVDRMQAFYEKTQDFTADFRQDYTYKAFKRTQTSSGTVAFKKPGLMRWEYQKPTPKTFVLSGDKVYAHDPAAMTLTRGALDSSQLSASVTFLWGRGKLADEFSIAQVPCKDCKGTLLELTPLRPDPRFKKVKLEVDPKTAQVRRSIVVDPDGSENAITFSNLKANTGLTEEKFKLSPPPNTQIVDLTRGK